MKRWIFLLIGIVVIPPCMRAQQEVIQLWNGKAPGSERWANHEALSPDSRIITNVSNPTLTVYLPEASKATGAAFVVCPGGGMRFLSWERDGTQVAEWLNHRGIAAFLLKYRTLPMDASPPRALPLATLGEIKNGNANPEAGNEALNAVIRMAIVDAGQALRIVRSRAVEWHVDPKKVGIMGFSAGSGVSIGAALGEKGEAYPDLLVALHGPSLIDVAVPSYAAPAFIAVGQGHPNVLHGSMALFTLWRSANRPAELHVYDAPIETAGESDCWRSLEAWLQGKAFLQPAEAVRNEKK